MNCKTIQAICLATVMSVAICVHPAFAGDGKIKFNNDMEIGIQGLYCAGMDNAGKLLLGPINKQSSVMLSSSIMPNDADCARMYVVLDNGARWQYYFDVDISPVKDIIFDYSMPRNMTKDDRTPSLLVTLPGDDHAYWAGLPIVALMQAMQFGMRKSDWTGFAVPGYDGLKNPGEYVIAFADTSWSLTAKGITYSDKLSDNMLLATEVELSAPVSNSMMMTVFTDLQEMGMGCTPWLFSENGKATAFTEEGKNLVESATMMDGLDSDDARWEAFHEKVANSIGGEGKMEMVFGNEDIHLILELGSEPGKAILRVVRNEGAALG